MSWIGIIEYFVGSKATIYEIREEIMLDFYDTVTQRARNRTAAFFYYNFVLNSASLNAHMYLLFSVTDRTEIQINLCPQQGSSL